MRHIWPLDVEATNEDHFFMKKDEPKLARAFVVYQRFQNVYGPLDALKRGTAFEELDQPYFSNRI